MVDVVFNHRSWSFVRVFSSLSYLHRFCKRLSRQQQGQDTKDQAPNRQFQSVLTALRFVVW